MIVLLSYPRNLNDERRDKKGWKRDESESFYFLFEWFFFLGAARERMCTRVTKLNWDAIEMAAEIIDSNNRSVHSRLSVASHDPRQPRRTSAEFSARFTCLVASVNLVVERLSLKEFATCRENFESSQRNFWKIIEIRKYFQSHLSKIVSLRRAVVRLFLWKL